MLLYNMGDLSPHFSAKEFQCHDGSSVPGDFNETIADTVEFLECLRFFMNQVIQLRARTGKYRPVGLRIISGHRNKAYNKRIGGSKRSAHVSGHAADVTPIRGFQHGFSYKEFHKMCEIIDRNFKDRQYRLGKYTSSGFVHVDCRYPDKFGYGGRRWGK